MSLFTLPDLVLRDLLQACCAAHRHGRLEFADDLVHIDLEALSAAAIDCGENGTADEHGVRAECNRAEHVDAGAYAAVNDDGEPALYGVCDRGQDLGCGRYAALNTPAVVGNNYCLCTGLCRLTAPAGVMIPLIMKGIFA